MIKKLYILLCCCSAIISLATQALAFTMTESDYKRLLKHVGREGKYDPRDFNAQESFNNYAYWLGICNLRDEDLSRAQAAFTISWAMAKEDPAQEEKGLEEASALAVANCLLGLIRQPKYYSVENLYDGAVRYYKMANAGGLQMANLGLAVAYALKGANQSGAEEAEIISAISDYQNEQSQDVLIFYSLVKNNKNLFLSTLNKISEKRFYTDPLLASNVAIGIDKFASDDKKKELAAKLWEHLEDNKNAVDVLQSRSPLIISAPLYKGTSIGLSRLERRQVARIHLNTIGWANKALDGGSRTETPGGGKPSNATFSGSDAGGNANATSSPASERRRRTEKEN